MKFARPTMTILAGMLLTGMPQRALADCGAVCSTRPVVRHVEPPVIVTPVVATTFIPVVVPSYSVGPYSTGYAPVVTPSPEVDALKAELAKLRASVDALKFTSPAPPPKTEPVRPAPTLPPAPAKPTEPTPKMPAAVNDEAASPLATVRTLFGAKCAACHAAALADAKGGGLTLLSADGTLAKLDDRQIRKITSDLYAGRMPKKGAKLSDQEVGVWMTYVAGLK